jgi:hypothetical protein
MAPTRLATLVAVVLLSGKATAATIDWKGHTWQVTSGGMAGVCQGDPANVTIDADGALHLRVTNASGTWKAAEIFTTDRLGFGTYQWQLDGPIDTYDKNLVVGLFPYGPAAGIGGDGTNEIDIEFSRWGVANGPNGDFTDYPASGTMIGELSYDFSLQGSTLATARFVWNTSSITSSLFAGLQPVSGNSGLLKTFAYAPPNPTTNIPQQALPLGMNFWCFAAMASGAAPSELVVRDFTFIPEGAGGDGGMAGAAGDGTGGTSAAGRGGSGGSSGASGAAGAARAGAAGASGSGAAGRSGAGGMASGGSSGRGGGSGMAGAGGIGAMAGGAPGAGGAPAGGRAGSTAGHTGLGGTGVTAGAGGAPSSGGGATDSGKQAGGCGCTVPRTRHDAESGIAALVALALTAQRRRRRARRPS